MASSKFHHEEIHRGKELTQKLSKHTLTVCGAGALGSNLVDNLTRQAFTNIKVIDKDRVEVHNLNTQVYADADVGALKVEALKNKVFRNIGTEIEAVNKELTPANVKQLLKKSTLVLDCFDNNAARQTVQDEVRARKIPCLHCGLFGEGGYGEVIWDEFYKVPRDQTEGDVCDYPLARNLVCLVVNIASEEIIDFCLSVNPRLINWSVTLKDLAIKPLIIGKV
jgi:molybdopterin/thiamine biosynthesis adenylyltransferase